MTQCQNVKELQAKLGLTQKQFAAKVGVIWATVNRWENGGGRLSPLAMRRVEDLTREAEDIGQKPSQ